MKVSEWLASHDSAIVTVHADSPLARVAERLLAETCLRDVYVVDEDGRLAGIPEIWFLRGGSGVRICPAETVHSSRKALNDWPDSM